MPLFEYGPIDDTNFITIGGHDDLIWVPSDRGTDEIWVATLAD